MNTIPPIVDATLDHFNDLLDISREVPVMVDFWAEWCGPCQSLMPILTKLAGEYQGKFILAKVNIDAQQELAMQFGVRSVPTVILFRHGKPVDQFMGVQPESEIRRFIEPHLSRPADARIQAARESLERHDAESALEQARAALAEDEAYVPAQLVLIEALLTAGKVEDAGARIDQLPVDMLADPAVERLRALRLFAEAAADAPEQAALEQAVAADEGDLEARYRLAARLVQAGDYEPALEHYLAILRRNRNFGDDAARKAMVAVFDLLGGSGSLVSRYRAKMAQALY